MNSPTWQYNTATGVPVQGDLVQVIEGQGSDITYVFVRATGQTDVISGSNLKHAKRIN